MGIRDRRGVSPVIATIIIVAIAIVMALAVAYWMLGLGGAFTRFEKLEFKSAYATKVQNDTNGYYFVINMTLQNTGSADATTDIIFLNGKPSTSYTGINEPIIDLNITSNVNDSNITLIPGAKVEASILLNEGDTWKSGATVEIMIQTVSGRQYPKAVVLP